MRRRPVEIRPEAKPAEVKAAEPKAPETRAPEKPALSGDDVDWMWPANGKLIAPYAEGGSKGVDIAGKTGDPVLAAADGVVSYAGAGLRGYGNLVVLRHNATFLSVYAHNSKLLVKEKDAVTRRARKSPRWAAPMPKARACISRYDVRASRPIRRNFFPPADPG
jgi:lipoprotein NlpD